MAKLEHSDVIKAPVEKVFEFMNNPEKELLWRPELIEMEQISEGPPNVGTTYREVTEFMGKKMETTAEITEYVPNKISSMKSTSGPISFELRGKFEPVEGGTRVTMEIEGEIGGFFKVAESVVIKIAKKQMEKQFERLKTLLEAQG
jgi:carbon monoxide dehydrogenase subunit G